MRKSEKCDKPTTVDEYIQCFDSSIQEYLILVRNTMRHALPNAKEKISWSMPTYWDGHNIIHFAANQKHVGIYPGSEAVLHFASQLDELGYSYSKGSIRMPYDNISLKLIEEIAIWCQNTGNHT